MVYRKAPIKRFNKNQKQVSFLKKAIAFIIDLFILNIFILPGFSGIITKVIPSGIEKGILDYYNILSYSQEITRLITFITIIISVYILLYFSLTEYLAGATFGMIVMNLKVIDKDNSNPSFFISITRNLFSLPFFPFILLWIIDPLYLFMKKEGQRFSEYITRTKIVEIYR